MDVSRPILMSRILIIEDEATVRDTLALNLRAEGHEVITAGDGVSSLQLAREQAPHLVILDLMLPPPDGPSLCRMLPRDSRLPLLLLPPPRPALHHHPAPLH